MLRQKSDSVRPFRSNHESNTSARVIFFEVDNLEFPFKEEEELNERQRAFDEANAADSRPSTAHSELGLTDAELDLGEDEGKEGYEEVDFDIFKADNI